MFKVWCLVWCLVFWVEGSGLGFRVQVLGFGVWGLNVWGLGFRVGFRVEV